MINVIKNKYRSSREGSCDNSIGESLDSSSEAYNVLDQTGSFTQDVSQAEANSSRNSIGYREPKAHSTRSNCNPHTLKPPFQPNFHPYFSATNCAPYLDWPSASHLSLPHIQISKFSGDIAEYPAFVQEFKSFVEPVCLDAHRRLLYLKLYLVGEAAEVIKGCNSYYNKQEGYYKAWELLDQRYGDSMLLLKRVKEEILHGPTICISDVKRFKASDPGSSAVWGSKRINPRPQSCLCLTWSEYLFKRRRRFKCVVPLIDLLCFNACLQVLQITYPIQSLFSI